MDYQTRFFANLSEIYKSMEDSFYDVMLLSIEDGTKWPSHRVILSASSDYFKNVFKWSTSDVVEVHNGITGETIELILKYIYSGEISINFENVNDILVAANYFVLMEVVECCITFILNNLEISNSLDMLAFSWQLNLSELINGIVHFVAENFSYILSDPTLTKRFSSLPIELIAKLLNSNNLVLRDKETRLLTRPPEREKLILEYILSYSESLEHSTSDDITLLLSCVKWPLLNIFGENEFIFTKIAPLLDNGNRKEELERLFNVTHSDWFMSNGCVVTSQDKSTYTTRAFSCSELVPLHPMADRSHVMTEMAGGNSVGRPPKSFLIIAKPNEHLVKLDIVTTTWAGSTIVGGIILYFLSAAQSNLICGHIGEVKENGTEVHTINLEVDEHITGVYGNSSWVIDSLSFETSKNRVFGPYGGDGGEEVNFMSEITKYRDEGGFHAVETYNWHKSIVCGPHKRTLLDSILVGINGKEVRIGDEVAITNLSFIFREMLPSSNFLITKEKIYEVPSTDMVNHFLEADPYDEYEESDQLYENYCNDWL